VKYTMAIKALEAQKDTTDLHVLYSNRSASFLQMARNTKALEDAQTCVKMKPEWPKGYWRMARALEELQQKKEAEEALMTGLKLEPTNAEMLKSLKKLNPKAIPPSPPIPEKSNSNDDTGYSTASGLTNKDALLSEDVAGFASLILKEIAVQFATVPEEKISMVSFRAKAYLLPEDNSKEQMVIAIEKAFQSPETNIECTYFLRDTVANEKCKAALIIAQKSTIAYPEHWKHKSKDQWKFDERQDGLFVQLETTDTPGKPIRVVHFLSITPRGNSFELSEEPYFLDVDNFSLMPPLFRGTPEPKV